MENASKALIIAGAILISILIVGLGVIIYNNVSGIAQSGTLDAQEITAHNSPFESYFGNNVSGSNVKALITQVTANNNAAKGNDETVGNWIYFVDGTGAKLDTSKIQSGKTYNVNLYTAQNAKDYDDTEAAGAAHWVNGYIKTICIKDPVSSNNP